MYKLLSSTAFALVFVAPAWAESMNTLDTGFESAATDRGSLIIAQNTDTLEADDNVENLEEEVPDVTESQPGVITGEDVDEEDAGAMAPGSAGGSDNNGSDTAGGGSDGGDTAEGGGTDGGAGGSSGSSGSGAGGSGD